MKLEIGYDHPFEIRTEQCFTSFKDSFTILYLSDLHLNRFGHGIITKVYKTIEALNPTIILFGGDYVDSEKGLCYFNDLLAAVSKRNNMFAIAGNHDYYFGIDKIEKAILEGNVIWLEKRSTNLNLENTIIKIDGNLLSKEKASEDFSILLLHKPLHTDQFRNHYDLAFAGHLHGSQFVFWQTDNKLFPGRFFYKWNILKAKLGNCQYFISKGLGDTLPIRYNCKRDVIFIQVSNKN